MEDTVDMLILGAGWTSTFLIPELRAGNYSYAATSTTGRGDTIRFRFNLESDDLKADFARLPRAKTVLVTFPLVGTGQSRSLVELYRDTHPPAAAGADKKQAAEVNFIQLGSTGIWQSSATRNQDNGNKENWVTRHSAYDTSNLRAVAEDELLAKGGCILNLSGLWGGTRQPADFVDRVITDRQSLLQKGSLHMIHGRDVARAIVAVMTQWPGPSRWMLTDLFVYDWWSLVLGWGSSSSPSSSSSSSSSLEPEQSANHQAQQDGTAVIAGKDAKGKVLNWVLEGMQERNVRGLPRSMQQLGRCYDSREFWTTFDLTPVRARI